MFAFVELRSILTRTADSAFAGGADERARLLAETETDYVSLVAAGAEAVRLETLLESADREATEHELDTAKVLLEQLGELALAVFNRLP